MKMTKKNLVLNFFDEIRKNWILFLMLSPVLIYFLVFNYLPMIGIYFAFTRFNFADGLFGSPFVGFENFIFLIKSGILAKLTLNTVSYNLAFILFGNLLQIFSAILLSRIGNQLFKKVSQSFIFIPYFISFVVVNAFILAILDPRTGMITMFLDSIGVKFNAYTTPWVWKYILVVVNLWKNVGYGTVIYLAAIMGISEDIYEAADIDGANIFHKIKFITIPLLTPTIIILLLLSLGNILSGQFEMFYQLIGNNGQLFDATDILDTYVFRTLRVTFDLGMGTAAGLYQSVFGCILVTVVNTIIRRKDKDLALF